MRDRLRELAPGSALLGDELRDGDGAELAAGRDGSEDPALQPLDAEAPAVPVTRSEQEFVAGRLTQAEILEKYGLRQQALDQLREVTTRFPGHVEGLQRLVEMLRVGASRHTLAEALARLALALRAMGSMEEGARVAEEAAELGELSDPARTALEQVDLLQHDEQPAELQPEVATAGSEGAGTAGDEIVIEFDEGATSAAPPPPVRAAPSERPAPRATARPTRAPSQDMLDEIRFYIEQGQREDAARRVQVLGALGYASPELSALATSLTEATAPAMPSPAATGAEDDELDAIAAALEEELLAGDELVQPAPLPQPASSDQSLDDIFAAFKHHVQQEVDSEDFQTHYDLGIAYKEMGLMEEAIREFEIVTRFEALYREACSMIAICHRDRSEMHQAAAWYRQALEAPGGDAEAQSGLRYDLAEVLLESGDTEGALDLFRNVMRVNPSFRDVRSRVTQLEARIES
jgi:tetratricopeptide (TPR) repeat protein